VDSSDLVTIHVRIYTATKGNPGPPVFEGIVSYTAGPISQNMSNVTWEDIFYILIKGIS